MGNGYSFISNYKFIVLYSELNFIGSKINDCLYYHTDGIEYYSKLFFEVKSVDRFTACYSKIISHVQ